MFTIKSYLQYKNTPDGKPRVLKLPKEYQFFIKKTDVTPKNILTYQPIIIEKEYLTFFDTDYCEQIEVLLEDCKPLLTVEIDGSEWTEGDIAKNTYYTSEWYKEYYFKYGVAGFNINCGLEFRNIYIKLLKNSKKEIVQQLRSGGGSSTKASKTDYIGMLKKGSFFDDPEKWSKLLWNCSELEGWKKIFDILNIKN